MKCVFCELPEIQERMIIKNDLAQAFLTNIPITPGHTLITPVRCVSNIDDLTKKETETILDLQQKIKHLLVKTFEAEGFNIAWNEGKLAGQSVSHFHLHVVPRKEGDSGITEYEPRKFLYRPGSREATPEAELQAVTELIKKSL